MEGLAKFHFRSMKLIAELIPRAEQETQGIIFVYFIITEYKKAHSEMKKASQETCRLQKKVNKGEQNFE